MTGGPLGPAFFIANILIVLFSRNSMLYKMLVLLTMSLPFSFIGIAGMEMIHVLSWYNFFLVVFLALFFPRLKLSVPAGSGILLIFMCLVLSTLWAFDPAKAWIEICQIMVMLLPTALVFSSRSILPINSEETNRLVAVYGHVTFLTAVGMLIQYYFIFFRGTQIGLVNFTGNGRISCYALFRGTSILPVYMGSGLVTLFMQNLSKKSLIDIIEILIIFLAMILNSSRAGVFALFCIIGYVMIMRTIKKFSIGTLFLLIALFIIGFLGLGLLMSTREGLESFTDENGREVTFINGIDIWLASPRNFLFGEGFTGGMWEGITKTHNFIIQTLAQNGIIVASIIFTMILAFIRKIRKTPLKYIAWFVVLSGMLVTDFYANAFTSIVFILVSFHRAHPEVTGAVKYKKLL